MARKKTTINALKQQKRASKRVWLILIPAVLLVVFAILFTWIFQTRDIIARIGSQTITQSEMERLKLL